MALKDIFTAVSQNAAAALEDESVRAAGSTQLVSGALGVVGLPSSISAQSSRISGTGDIGVQESDQGDRAQVEPSTLNKVPRIYGNVTTSGVITDAVKNNANSLIYCLTISETNADGFDLANIGGIIQPGWKMSNVYRDNDKLLFSAFSGDEHDVITLNNLEDNTNVSISGTNAISVYAWAGNAHANAQIFPSYGLSGPDSIYRQNAYDIMPGWTSSNTMEDLVFAIVQVNRLESANANITNYGTFRFDVEPLGKQPTNISGDHQRLYNPAYALWDYLTDDRYGCGLANADIDTTAFDDWADYCAENKQWYDGSTVFTSTDRFTANAFINPQVVVTENIKEICKAGMASFAYNGKTGKFTVYVNRQMTAGEKSSAFHFTDDNIISGISYSSSDIFSLFNFNQTTFPNYLQQDKKDTLIVQTPTADKITNEPTSGMSLSINTTNTRWRSADIANITLKQSRITNIAKFTGDHSTLQVDVGDFVKVTNKQKGWDEKYFRVVRTTENNEAGALSVQFTLIEYADTPFDKIIYTDEKNSPFATGVGTEDNYNANSSLSFYDPYTEFVPHPDKQGIYESAYLVDNPASGNGNIIALSNGAVVGTETITNIRALAGILKGDDAGAIDANEPFMLVRTGTLVSSGEPAYSNVHVELVSHFQYPGFSPAINSTESITEAGQFNYNYSLFRLNKVTSGIYKVKVKYDYKGYIPTKTSQTYESANITIDERTPTGNTIGDNYGFGTYVYQTATMSNTSTIPNYYYNLHTPIQHNFANAVQGDFTVTCAVVPQWNTIPTYAHIAFAPTGNVTFVNTHNNSVKVEQFGVSGFDYTGNVDMEAAGINGVQQVLTGKFSTDPAMYGLDKDWYISRANVVMQGITYGSGNDISFANVQYSLANQDKRHGGTSRVGENTGRSIFYSTVTTVA